MNRPSAHEAIEAIGLEKTFAATTALARARPQHRGGQHPRRARTQWRRQDHRRAGAATLLRPDRGIARVAGFDVTTDAVEVRRRIGLAGQYAALDECLTGRANLVMVGQLCRLSARSARRRAGELLVRFDLTDAADRGVKTYSGGMRRRLDLAASLVARPEVLFLDEPTTGLDPRSRLVMWAIIRGLVADGTTVLLTTQHLDEADQLADRIAVIDQGRMIAEGTSASLKADLGGERVEITVASESSLGAAGEVLARHGSGPVHVEPSARRVDIAIAGGARRLPAIVIDLDAAGVLLDDLVIRRPSLDDVFLSLTGHPAGRPPLPA